MAKARRSRQIEDLFAILERDWKGLHRKYPDQAIFALGEPRVVAALEQRFSQASTIKNIRLLEYDFLSGLNKICFEFNSAGHAALPAPDAILVVMDGNCKVVGVVDPFDPLQPNVFVPPLPKHSEQPFVLDRPSAAASLSFSDQELYPVQVRSREFFQRLTAGGSGPIADLIRIHGTKCDYATQTPGDWLSDNTVDDCGTPPILA